MSLLPSTITASNVQMDYMKLLITQLKNQDPLEPLDNNDMATQLAHFSELAQLESMNANFARVLATVQHSYASSLIGKNIEFITQTETGDNQVVCGIVEQVYSNSDGEIFLAVGDYMVALEDVMSVKN
jgi:flagellar basal-body rod modification protein FlgD